MVHSAHEQKFCIFKHMHYSRILQILWESFMFQSLEIVSVQYKTCMNNYVQQLLFQAGNASSQELAVDW